ncbi:MAG: ribosome silencing factor [Rhodospirillaceae bacterium]
METTITSLRTSSDVQEPPSRGKDAIADAADLVRIVCRSLDDDKAEDISVIDLAGKTSIADFMVIASGRSSRQVGAIADHMLRRLKDAGLRPATEGKANSDWVIVDAGSVIVHIFRPEVRAFYNLEKMWGHIPAAEETETARPFGTAGFPPPRGPEAAASLNA